MMTTLSLKRVLRVALLLALCAEAVDTYAQTSIVADPNAKRLRLLWYVQGPEFGGGETRGRVGSGVGGLGDIYGTGTNAWAVNFGLEGDWRIYNGYTGDITQDTVPVQEIRGGGPYPIVGDFWGTGKNAVVFVSGVWDTSGPSSKFYTELHAHRTESNWIDTAIATMMNTRTMDPIVEIYPNDYLVADLNKDGADELILPLGGVTRDSVLTQWGEFWIFKGGNDFQLDTPSIIIKVSEIVGGPAYLGDFDGDNHIDIVTWINKANSDPHTLMFYYGDGTIDGYAKPENRRVITLGEGYPRSEIGIQVLDCDGDGLSDLVMGAAEGPDMGVYVYRSRTGKNMRTRSFMLNDADNKFTGPERIGCRLGGHLNDSAGRFDMLLLFDGSDVIMKALSGGTNGPNNTYDAYYDVSGIWGIVRPLPDIDGDGWDDLITGNSIHNFNAGIAAVLAGGPEIPRDPTMGVEAIAGEGHTAAISTWPNPVRDELHIAWRGDLKHMPHRFIVRDILGHDIAFGEVEPGTAAARWSCTTIQAGVYFLSMYDSANALIATTRVIKYQ